MDFKLIDFYSTVLKDKKTGQPTNYDVIVLYEMSSHIPSRVWFLHNDKTFANLTKFFEKNCDCIVTNYIKYKLNDKGRPVLQIVYNA